MNNSIAVKAENLGKAYQLGQIGTGTISRDIERWLSQLRGKDDPFLRIGETNDRSKAGNSDIVWSLRDINFEIEQGDAVGIIGRNGAGKSTLLKILSKVTSPTTGKISGKGRIASLLEVGTGFHPELSGRENIFLNGAILGMRKKEIQRKFDEIVDFAGVERYIDTPVKRYSSGMYVRLAFAVAAHLESEILIVDEVLAVGDAEFQKKCLGKMGDVSKGEGRTVLFVSHNMGSIQRLCTKSIVLGNGLLISHTDTLTAINQYQKTQINEVSSKKLDVNYEIKNVLINPSKIHSLDSLELSFEIHSNENRVLNSISPMIFDENNQRIAIMDLRNQLGTNVSIAPNKPLRIKIKINQFPILEGDYMLGIYLNDQITVKDFFDIHRFQILPIKEKPGEIIHEYEKIYRGFLNLDFKSQIMP